MLPMFSKADHKWQGDAIYCHKHEKECHVDQAGIHQGSINRGQDKVKDLAVKKYNETNQKALIIFAGNEPLDAYGACAVIIPRFLSHVGLSQGTLSTERANKE